MRDLHELASLAMEHGHLDVLEWALRDHMEQLVTGTVDQLDFACIAAMRGDVNGLRILRKYGVPFDLDCRANHFNSTQPTTPAALAVIFRRHEAYRYLRECEAPLLAPSEPVLSPTLLLPLLYSGDMIAIREIVTAAKVAPDATYNGVPAAYPIALLGERELLDIAIRSGLDPNFRLRGQNTINANALEYAVREVSTRAVTTLLSHQAVAVDIRDDLGRLPLFALQEITTEPAVDAVREIVSAFRSRGFDINSTDPSSCTVLHSVALRGPSSALHALLREPGIQLNARDSTGRTPLHLAVLNNRLARPSFEAMLRAGADPTLRNDIGQTPAEYAIRQGRRAHARILEQLADQLAKRTN